jgi:hypothetical protein
MSCSEPRERVAHGPGCTVERCGCGTLHITIGPVTMRIERSMFVGVLPTLVSAGERLAREREPLQLQ